MAKEYIEREAAFNAVLKLVPKVDDDGYCWVIRGDAARAIDSIPAADVVPVGAYNQAAWERDTAIEQLKQIGKSFGEQMDDVRPVVRGKWIQKKSWTRGVCSACSWEIAFVTGNSYSFCPNCGADMREES